LARQNGLRLKDFLAVYVDAEDTFATATFTAIIEPNKSLKTVKVRRSGGKSCRSN
jgi:hypothetical protein